MLLQLHCCIKEGNAESFSKTYYNFNYKVVIARTGKTTTNRLAKSCTQIVVLNHGFLFY